ncbi:MAG TPA: DUF503 domain-containing protein [Candidatus Eisenbacteria bacterium]|nr:DUF503 domain-containing protein [Candidatus Eisenbacteria bacterium]
MRLELHLPASDSLKAKRSVLNRVKERVRSGFNASVAEVEYQDLWQRAALGIAIVGSAPGALDNVLRDILRAVEREDRLQVLDFQIRIL